MNDIIITAPAHPILIETLERNGEKLLYAPAISYDELLRLIPNCKGLVVSTRLPIDKTLLEGAVNLKWIGRLGSGMDIIDTAFAAANGIQCFSSPEGNCDAVAEHALGILLSLTKKICLSASEVRNAIWKREENRGMEIRGKTIGIIGYGHTGSAFARLLHGFGCRILAYDKYRLDFGEDTVIKSDLSSVLSESDIVSIHLPLNAETRQFADIAFFRSLKKVPVFVNTSRGEIIDEDALVQALQQNLISAAALDVLENEKPDQLSAEQKGRFDYLTSSPNVIITPHIAGYSRESFLKMSQILLQKIGYE